MKSTSYPWLVVKKYTPEVYNRGPTFILLNNSRSRGQFVRLSCKKYSRTRPDRYHNGNEVGDDGGREGNIVTGGRPAR